MIAYKFLKPDSGSVFTGFKWELPTVGVQRDRYRSLLCLLELEVAGGILAVGGVLGRHPADK